MSIISSRSRGLIHRYEARYEQVFKPRGASAPAVNSTVWLTTAGSAENCGVVGLSEGQSYLITGDAARFFFVFLPRRSQSARFAARDRNNELKIHTCAGMPVDNQQLFLPTGALIWSEIMPDLRMQLQRGRFRNW